MLLHVVLGFQLLSPEWLAVATRTTDSHEVYVHDQKSGALITVSSGLGVMAPEQRRLSVRNSKQLVRRRSGAVGRTKWEAFELSDSAVGARSLRADMGADPEPGSWPAALLEALTPPPPCSQEVEAFIEDGKGMVALKTVICSPEQRARVDQYVGPCAHGGRPHQRVSVNPKGGFCRIGHLWRNAC